MATLRELIGEKSIYRGREIGTGVTEMINEISVNGKASIQEKLKVTGVEVLSITVKEAYNKREKQYYSLG